MVNILYDIIVPKPFTFFYVIHDHVTNIWQFVTVRYNITLTPISQISYSLVVMLELNSISEVQYKEIMIIGNE